MNQSATSAIVAERKEATSARLTALARRLTAEQGLAGFTVEALCSEVGVSRRTFFNYFPSKEDAVLGIDSAEDLRRLGEQFLGRGSRGWPAVVDDLVTLAAEHADEVGMSKRAHTDLIDAIDREPRLLRRFIGLTRDRERALAELVAEREGVTADDPLARAAVQVFSMNMRSAGELLLDRTADTDFGTALADSLAAIRAVTATTSPTEPNRTESE